MGSQVIIQGTYALGLANLYLKQHTLVSLYPHSLILHTLFYGPEITYILLLQNQPHRMYVCIM